MRMGGPQQQQAHYSARERNNNRTVEEETKKVAPKNRKSINEESHVMEAHVDLLNAPLLLLALLG